MFDGKTKYAYLKQISTGEIRKDAPIIGALEELLLGMFVASDFWNHVMNANSDETRMIKGTTSDECIYNLKVEGLEPTEILIGVLHMWYTCFFVKYHIDIVF